MAPAADSGSTARRPAPPAPSAATAPVAAKAAAQAGPARALLRPHGSLREDWRAFTWRMPDWWLGAAGVAAWMALTAMFLAMATGSLHAGHASGGEGAEAALTYGVLLGSWAVMVVAMMLPLVRGQARWLALRSLRRRRQHAVATFTVAFLVVWLAFGALAVALLGPVRGELWAVALGLAAAALWQAAPARGRLLRRCATQRAPAVRGSRALRDWAGGGLRSGRRCVGTCAPLMLPMAVAHHPALMVGAALVIASERRRAPNPETRGGRRLEALWIGAAAVAAAIWGLAG